MHIALYIIYVCLSVRLQKRIVAAPLVWPNVSVCMRTELTGCSPNVVGTNVFFLSPAHAPEIPESEPYIQVHVQRDAVRCPLSSRRPPPVAPSSLSLSSGSPPPMTRSSSLQFLPGLMNGIYIYGKVSRSSCTTESSTMPRLPPPLP